MVGDFSGISNLVGDRSPMTPTVVQPLDSTNLVLGNISAPTNSYRWPALSTNRRVFSSHSARSVISRISHFNSSIALSTSSSSLSSLRDILLHLFSTSYVSMLLCLMVPSTIKHGIQILPQLFNTPTSSSTEYDNCMQS